MLQDFKTIHFDPVNKDGQIKITTAALKHIMVAYPELEARIPGYFQNVYSKPNLTPAQKGVPCHPYNPINPLHVFGYVLNC